MAKSLIDFIQNTVRGRTVLNAPMSELTTLKVGGPADILVYPADREDLAGLLRLLEERTIPYCPVGAGSNLVVRDGGIRGAVINLEEGFRALQRGSDEGARATFRVEAGVALRRLVRWTVDEGIGGLEGLAGIPGSLGGALAMNAGAWGFEISQTVREVEVIDSHGDFHTLQRENLRFSYRKLDLAHGTIVVGAMLFGEVRPPAEVKANVQELLARRKECQPLQEPSAGSVFKNPPGEHAGRLIDQCGLKGVRLGDAEISRLHANFIVNSGMATAAQVVAMMGMIQERVYVRFKIRLEPEVVIVGDWEKGKFRIRE